MRIVYMGTPDIAKTCLQAICEGGYEVVGVYTKPDTPKNRGMKMAMSPVKEYALSQNLPVYQPTTFKDEAVMEELKALAPDLIVVVAYGKLLPQKVLDLPQHGCINMHASILPELRGAGPVQWSILNHCKETGVTAMYMSAGMDEGDMIEVRRTPIDPNETGAELMDRLAVIAAGLACDTIDAIANGTVTRCCQCHEKATYAPMLSKALCPIDWNQSFEYINDQVRGLIPWPVATTCMQGKNFKIFKVEDAGRETDAKPGKILALTKKGLEIACGDGKVARITQLQAEGGKRMAAADYFRGHPIEIEP